MGGKIRSDEGSVLRGLLDAGWTRQAILEYTGLSALTPTEGTFSTLTHLMADVHAGRVRAPEAGTRRGPPPRAPTLDRYPDHDLGEIVAALREAAGSMRALAAVAPASEGALRRALAGEPVGGEIQENIVGYAKRRLGMLAPAIEDVFGGTRARLETRDGACGRARAVLIAVENACHRQIGDAFEADERQLAGLRARARWAYRPWRRRARGLSARRYRELYPQDPLVDARSVIGDALAEGDWMRRYGQRALVVERGDGGLVALEGETHLEVTSVADGELWLFVRLALSGRDLALPAPTRETFRRTAVADQARGVYAGTAPDVATIRLLDDPLSECRVGDVVVECPTTETALALAYVGSNTVTDGRARTERHEALQIVHEGLFGSAERTLSSDALREAIVDRALMDERYRGIAVSLRGLLGDDARGEGPSRSVPPNRVRYSRKDST